MSLPKEALDLIKEFEGYLKPIPGTDMVRPYLCPAGVPTIGWGTTFYPGGRKVTMNDPPIGKDRATECLAYELTANEVSVDKLTPGITWHPLMRGAIVSFIYNCGDGAYRASTLRKRILAKEWDDVPAQLAKWNKGGGRVLAGLTRRRAAEAALFIRGLKMMQKGASSPVYEAEKRIEVQPSAQKQPRTSPFARLAKWLVSWKQ